MSGQNTITASDGSMYVLEDNWTGITGVVGLLYGLIGAWIEYQQIQDNLDRMREIRDRMNEIMCERFECWKEGPFALMMSTKGKIDGWQPTEVSCDDIFNRVDPWAQCSINAVKTMETRLKRQYRLCEWPNQYELDALEARVVGTAQVAITRAKQRIWEKECEAKDAAMANLYRTLRSTDANAGEAATLMQQAAGGYATMLNSSFGAFQNAMGTASAGWAAASGGGGQAGFSP